MYSPKLWEIQKKSKLIEIILLSVILSKLKLEWTSQSMVLSLRETVLWLMNLQWPVKVTIYQKNLSKNASKDKPNSKLNYLRRIKRLIMMFHLQFFYLVQQFKLDKAGSSALLLEIWHVKDKLWLFLRKNQMRILHFNKNLMSLLLILVN